MILQNIKKVHPLHGLIGFWMVIYLAVIMQDYFYSAFRQTGFYWSEVTLFNLYWLLFIPFCWGAHILLLKRQIKNKHIAWQVLYLFGLALIFSVVHLVIFSGLISGISALVFSPSHSFERTLIASLSKDYWVSFIVYGIIPFLLSNHKMTSVKTFHESGMKKEKEQIKFLKIKDGNQVIKIDQASILYIRSDKPYASIFTLEGKYLVHQSLKSLALQLDASQLIRVHRSTIVNVAQIHKLTSRKNGDYDVLLKDGTELRFSRHFRENWEYLLSPST